jgi:hypothetical protein
MEGAEGEEGPGEEGQTLNGGSKAPEGQGSGYRKAPDCPDESGEKGRRKGRHEGRWQPEGEGGENQETEGQKDRCHSANGPSRNAHHAGTRRYGTGTGY